MKLYAWVLTFAILVTHLGYNKLSAVTGIDAMTIFYSAMGNLSAVLMGLLGVALSTQKKSFWKLAVFVALGVGISEGLMMNCIFFGPYDYGMNVCDYHATKLVGKPMYVGLTVNVLSVFISSFLFGRAIKNEQRNASR